MTRIEEYIKAIVEGWTEATLEPYPDYPSWRLEEFLDAFITYIWEDGDHPRHPCPEPVWHIEECLRAIYDVMTGAATPWPFPAPTNRIEKYLEAIHAYLVDGTELPVPEPVWRIEQWLAYVLDAVKQGGGVETTVSGTLVHITNALAKAALSVLVSISPTQDLHGYDSPWPAGGGKNKCNFADIDSPSTTNTDYSISLDSASYVISFDIVNAVRTNLGNTSFVNVDGSYFTGETIFKVSDNSTLNSAGANINGRYYLKFTGAIATVSFLWRSNSYANLSSGAIKNIQIEVGTSPSAFSPYSNICPITGWTGAKVTRTGKNLLNPELYGETLPKTQSNITFTKVSDGVYHAKGIASGNAYYNVTGKGRLNTAMPASGLVGSPLYLSISGAGASQISHNMGYFKADGSYANSSNGGVLPDIAVGLRCYLKVDSGTDIDADFSVQMEIGSTATAYEPYQGNTYDITFPTEAGTVYGGTVDVVSGVLTVDRAMVDLGTLNWIYRSNLGGMSATLNPIGKDRFDAICSAYPFGGSYSDLSDKQCGYVYNNQIFVKDNDYTDAATFKTAMSGVQLVYELATPITYQLTPQEVQMLLGENYVWSSSGDTVSVTYYAEGNANDLQSLNILLGGNYSNPKTSEDVSDKEALEIILGGNK